MRPGRLFSWTVLIGAGVALSLAAHSLYRLMEDIKSEYETIRVVQMIEDSVTAHDGNWPSSW
ncbi:MAG: hypothetical protein AMXMBFR13_49610 [Phycisphaerae bacterium]